MTSLQRRRTENITLGSINSAKYYINALRTGKPVQSSMQKTSPKIYNPIPKPIINSVARPLFRSMYPAALYGHYRGQSADTRPPPQQAAPSKTHKVQSHISTPTLQYKNYKAHVVSTKPSNNQPFQYRNPRDYNTAATKPNTSQAIHHRSYRPEPVDTKPPRSNQSIHFGVHHTAEDRYRIALWSIFRERIMASYHNRRIFITYRNCPAVRNALLKRGWLEKIIPGRYKKLQSLSNERLLAYAKVGKEYEAVIISRLLESFPAFFIWQERTMSDMHTALRPFRNIVRRGYELDFTTKIGLIGCAEQSSWYCDPEVAQMTYPRFYRLSSSNEERIAFIKDFHFTQCVSLLRFVKSKLVHKANLNSITGGSLPKDILHFALHNIKQRLSDLDDDSLDQEPVVKFSRTEAIDWNKFNCFVKDIILKDGKFNCSYKQLFNFFLSAEMYLKLVSEKLPTTKWDGYHNLWILKPSNECRGYGIVIKNDLDDIFKLITEQPRQRYIVQKYIETPLLLYKAKFDIRQYMLLTISASKLFIWLYKDCYLRFSGQEFNLNDFSESIHLTNNSVQINYKNSKTRDDRLPPCNMWGLYHFQRYLDEHTRTPRFWETKIFPGIKRNAIAVVMSSLEATTFVENAFELYGCDFMLDEDYEPILIEINANPDMSPSTHITENLCPRVLNDLVKVVVDLPASRHAPTGDWEMIHEITYTNRRLSVIKPNMSLNGKSMTIMPMTKNKIKA